VESGGSKKARIKRIARWRHVVNTIEPSVCGGESAFCQVTLTASYLLLFVFSDAVVSTACCRDATERAVTGSVSVRTAGRVIQSRARVTVHQECVVISARTAVPQVYTSD